MTQVLNLFVKITLYQFPLVIIPFPTNNFTFRQNNLEDEILKKNQSYQAMRMIFI